MAEYIKEEMFIVSDMSMPNVKTTICIGNFTLYAYAYRKLTESECKLAVRQYMKKAKLKSVPKNGSGTIVTIIGGI